MFTGFPDVSDIPGISAHSAAKKHAKLQLFFELTKYFGKNLLFLLFFRPNAVYLALYGLEAVLHL